MNSDGRIASYLPDFSDVYSFQFLRDTNSHYNKGSLGEFYLDLDILRNSYENLEREYKRYACRYNEFCGEIFRDWGYEIPCLLDIERMFSRSQEKNLHEIHDIINKAARLIYEADFDKFRRELEKKYRERWLKEILNEAKEKNCSIVVIREKNFSPSFSSILIFVRDVEAKKSSNISDMWLAFNLKEKTPRASELIGLMKNNSFVEFIL